jgi:hypothetical protein
MIEVNDEGQVLIVEEQDEDPADGWLSEGRKPNGCRVREDFEVDPRLSSTNTDFGGEDPAKVDSEPKATFDPTEGSDS